MRNFPHKAAEAILVVIDEAPPFWHKESMRLSFCFASKNQSRSVLLLSSAFLFAAAPCIGLAKQVKIIVTGVVTSGTDQSGVFDAPGSNLAGKKYTQVFFIDDTKGFQAAKGIVAMPGSNPMKAMLTIDGGTLFYGVLPTHITPSSFVSRNSRNTDRVMDISTGGEEYQVGEAFGEGTAEASITFNLPPYTPSYNWGSALNYTTAPGNGSDGSFAIYYGYHGGGERGLIVLQQASGLLKVSQITETVIPAFHLESLEALTVSGGDNTSFWKIKWQLLNPSTVGGWIIQHVTSVHTIYGDPKSPYKSNYWEAWQVPAGSRGPVQPYDIWSTNSGGLYNLKTTTGTANFYEGIVLPSSFTPNGSGYSGTLMSTKPGVTPELPPPTTLPVLRSSTFFW